MGKYIHYFTAVTAYIDMRQNNYEEPWVSLTEEGQISDIDYNKTEKEKNLGTPLTFEITSSGNIVWKTSDTANTKTIEYKKNNDGEWTSITSTTGGTSIPVVSGDTVQFRGNNISYARSASNYNTFSGTTSNFKVKGNIMSLINPNNYANLTSFPEESFANFAYLFYECTGLTDASKLMLPATTLTQACYSQMFDGCTSLVNTPELPATTLADTCYAYMFQGCTSLVNAPELPATTLDIYCYAYMFQGCTSLVNAPELPATTSDSSCYEGMFQYCTSLTTAPELPATTLAQQCYSGMFSDCSNLNYIKCLATDISATDSTAEWVLYVASTGTFIIQNGTEYIWRLGNNGIPRGWKVYNMSGDDVTNQIQPEIPS